MAMIGSSPVYLSSDYGNGGLSRAIQSNSLCFQCLNRSFKPCLWGGNYSSCHVTPTCKMRSKNPRVYQRKAPVKKLQSKNLSPLSHESTTGDGNKEGLGNGGDTENGNVIRDAVEPHVMNNVATLPEPKNANGNIVSDVVEKLVPNNVGSLPELSVLSHDIKNRKGSATASPSALPGSSLLAEDQSFIDIVEDLMRKVQDAERNILMLNEARMQNLEQLEQMRRDKADLQSEMTVLQLQLEEADIKLKATLQEKAKMKLLEQEIESLQRKLLEKSEAAKVIAQQNEEYKELKKRLERMQLEAQKLSEIETEVNEVNKEKQLLQEEVESLKDELSISNKKSELTDQLRSENDTLQKTVSEMQTKLATAESDSLELAKLKLEKQVIRENLHKFETMRPTLSVDLNTPPQQVIQEKTDELVKQSAENKAMQEKIDELTEILSKFEEENEILQQAQTENEILRNQVKLLEERLEQSDAEIRSQLEVYQAEVESFQATLEQLKTEKDADAIPEADDMPWEFWSNILVSIDGWLLEKQLLLEDATALREMAWQRNSNIKDVFITKKGAPDSDIISGLVELLKSKQSPGMHIIHIAAEMAPVAKVGGLGDVVTGLGKSLQRKGHLVEVVLPKYDCMDYSRINNLKVLNIDLLSKFDGHTFINKIWVGTVDGLPVYFIEPYHPGKLFWRGKVYGEHDDFSRFTYFSRAALEFVLQAGKRPDIIHCHDWHTAAVAPMYWNLYVPQGLRSARVAFTCHNFEYQGTEAPGALVACGLDPQQLHRPDRMQDNFMHERINLLKGGVVYSNIVTTVSPTYAEEVQSAEGGKGMQLTLTAHSHKFFGILNGIDTDSWNPASDILIDHQYSAEDITGKELNKAALRAALRLSGTGADAEKPIVGCVTRLVPQKGVHLIRHAIFRTLEHGGQFVLLGSSPVPHIQREFEALSHQFGQNPHVRLCLKYDEELSHAIYAGSDILVIPSIFEPCGLTQMIAMRYGAIPVVRRTGGLNDSVFDVDDDSVPLNRRNGFTFTGVNEQDLNSALDRSLKYYFQRRSWWQDLVQRVMHLDFSWNTSADQYAELYQRALTRARSSS